jgi:glycerophosphoryl diester phosphodiesterase
MLVIGHRGSAGNAFENTMDSIRKAVNIGVDLIEIDVQLSADGIPILFHDHSLNQKTNLSGKLADYTSAEIAQNMRTLDQQQLPTLQEACAEIAKGKSKLYLEVKSPDAIIPIIRVLQKSAIKDYYLASFYHSLLAKAKSHDDRIKTIAIFEAEIVDCVSYLKRISADIASIGYNSFSLRNFNELKQAGISVFVWTIDQPQEIDEFINLGVDGIVSNYPERIIKQLAANQSR